MVPGTGCVPWKQPCSCSLQRHLPEECCCTQQRTAVDLFAVWHMVRVVLLHQSMLRIRRACCSLMLAACATIWWKAGHVCTRACDAKSYSDGDWNTKGMLVHLYRVCGFTEHACSSSRTLHAQRPEPMECTAWPRSPAAEALAPSVVAVRSSSASSRLLSSNACVIQNIHVRDNSHGAEVEHAPARPATRCVIHHLSFKHAWYS